MNKWVLVSMVLMVSVCALAQKASTPSCGMVNVVDYGDLPKEDLGKVINRMFDKGMDNIYIPPMEGLYIATPICPPPANAGVRVRIVSDAPRLPKYQILCITGHDRPAIDLQGCIFTQIIGVQMKAGNGDPRGKASACAILMARPKDGACSSNHLVRDCLFEGAFQKCIIYNIGAEELLFENNYLAHYSVEGKLTEKNACYVISNFEVFPEIKSRGPRAENGVSNSVMTFRDEILKQYNPNASGFYIGQWSMDLNLDISFAALASLGQGEPKALITVNQQVHNINLRVSRMEVDSKKIHILYQTGNADCGAINILGGSFFRSGPAIPGAYLFELAGPETSKVALNISPECNFNMMLPGAEEIYVLNSKRKIVNSRIALMNGSPDMKVNVPGGLEHSELTMPQESNFKGKTKGCTLKFFQDEKTIIQNQVVTTQPVTSKISKTD